MGPSEQPGNYCSRPPLTTLSTNYRDEIQYIHLSLCFPLSILVFKIINHFSLNFVFYRSQRVTESI
jgi:hypothetical protein